MATGSGEHAHQRKASELFVEALENEGVAYVFAVPGEENLDLLDALRTSKKIRLILTRHEQGAAFMAATYGRLTGKAGVCMATLGPGATNFATPAAYSHLGAFPMIMITGQKPIKKSKQGQFQIVDIVQLFKPICKMARQIVNGNTIPALVREAFRLAEEERPGAVLLELPEDIAAELKLTGRTTPRSYEVATVMFTDFENFTIKSEKLSPEELVALIDRCFRSFDEIISRHNIEKIKTIGDAYLCVSGLPDPKDHNATNVVLAALEIIDVLKTIKHSAGENGYFNIRIGIHSGPLVAGVVGDKKFAYDIWGDTVNTAARMEQSSEPNRVNISQSTYELVKDKFNCTFRGKQPAKNKGMIEIHRNRILLKDF